MVTDIQNESDITGREAPGTIRKLVNPMEMSGEGMNTPKQVGDVLKSTNTVQDNLFAGYISGSRQFSIKQAFLKEFERKKMTGGDLDKKNFSLYIGLETMASKMALLELQSSNSIQGRFQDNIITALTGVVKKVWNAFSRNKNPNEQEELSR
jgi:hypothetical protein